MDQFFGKCLYFYSLFFKQHFQSARSFMKSLMVVQGDEGMGLHGLGPIWWLWEWACLFQFAAPALLFLLWPIWQPAALWCWYWTFWPFLALPIRPLPFLCIFPSGHIPPGMAAIGNSSRLSRSNFLEVSDCFDRPPSRQRPSSISSAQSSTATAGSHVRRSSSLQFPQSSHAGRREVQLAPEATPNFTFLQTAISHIKYSSASIYASTLSAAGLLSGVGLGGLRSPSSVDSTEAINLYSMMATYHCCFGLVRLRVASLLIGVATCLLATFLLCALLLDSPFPPTALLSEWQCQMVCGPAVLLLSLSMLASLLMLLALITDIHFLMLPFMLSCLLNMMASMGFGLVLLSNPAFPLITTTRSTPEQLVPAGLALISTTMVALFLWLFALSSFTFILIRDKRTIFRELFSAELGYDDEEMRESNPLLLRRSSSAPLDRINSAEF